MNSLIRQNANSISSFQELIAEFERIVSGWNERWGGLRLRCYFRGADKAEYSLNPGLLRDVFLSEDMEGVEDSIRYDFETRGRPYIPEFINTAWDKMFFMQHHGFPTRLLDWTESLSVALYFSCRDINELGDGCIWVMASSYLVEKKFGVHRSQVHPDFPGIEEYSLIDGRRDQKKFNEFPPLPIMPFYVSPRITAQIGRFTVHTFRENQLEEMADQDRNNNGYMCFLHQIIIPSEKKTILRRQSRLFGGASEETLFPDIDGLSRGMMWEYSEQYKRKNS